MDDAQLTKRILAAQKGDSKAFEQLLTMHYDTLYKMAYRWCTDPDMAQDIVQEVCLKLAKNIGQFRFQARFSTWLYRIVMHTAQDMQKNARHDVPLPPELPLPTRVDPIDQIEYRDTLQQIQKLPSKQRAAVLLVFAEGLSHKEAAFVMGCKESTVSWYIHRARKHLNHWLEEGTSSHE